MEAFELNVEKRTSKGSAANRRLRRQGHVPAIIYGGSKDPVMVSIEHNELNRHLENEGFYSHVIKIKVAGGKSEQAVLRDLQRHPANPFIEHADFLRVVADEKLRMSVPVHLLGEEECKGVKEGGGMLERMLNEVEVECLPADLPAYLELDVSELDVHDALHLNDLAMPEGVVIVALAGEEEDVTGDVVVSVQLPRAAVEDDEEEAAEAAEEAATEAGDAEESDEESQG